MNRILFLFSLIFVVLLAACSGEDNTDETAKDETPETVKYTTDDGEEIDIPKDPKRIVVMGSGYFGNLKQLDANIVGVHNLVQDSEVLSKEVGDIELIEEGNIEQVLNLDPDLIITYSTDENINELKEVAPTIGFDYEKWNYLDVHKELGKIVGKEDQANKWVADFEAKLDENKKKVQDKLGTDTSVSVAEGFSKDIYVYGTNWGRGTEIIYQGLEMKVPETIEEDVVETGWKKISAEEVAKYSGDFIFLGDGDPTTNKAIESTSVWKNLDAVKNDRVVEFDSSTFWFNDPLSLEYQLEFIVEQLTK